MVTRFSVPAQAENSAPKKMSSRSVTSFSFVSLSWLNGCARGGQRPGREDQRVRQGVMPGSGASPRATRTTRSGSSAASSGPRPNRRDMRSAAPRKKLEGDSPRAAPMIRFERASSRRPDARPRRPDSTTPPRAVSAITWSSRSGPRNVRASPRNGGSGHELQGSVFAGQPGFDQVSRTSKQSPAYRPTRHHHPVDLPNTEVRGANRAAHRSGLIPKRGLVREIEECGAATPRLYNSLCP